MSLVCGLAVEKKKNKKRRALVKRPKKTNNPTCVLLAKIIKRLGSKQTISKIVKKLGKRCLKFNFVSRVKASLNNLRRQVDVIQRKKKITRPMYNRLTKTFYQKLFLSLLSFNAIKNSNAGKLITKANARLKKIKKVPFSNSTIRKLAAVTGAKGKTKKSPFHALRKQLRRVARKNAAKKRRTAAKSKASKKPAKKPAKKTNKKSSKKTNKKPAKKTTKKTVKKTAKKPAKKTTKKPAKKTAKKPAKRTTKKPARKGKKN